MEWYFWVLIGVFAPIISVKVFFAIVSLIFWDEEGYRKEEIRGWRIK